VSNADCLLAIHQQKRPAGAFSPDAKSAGLRNISNQALLVLSTLASSEMRDVVWQAWQNANNMTDTMAALIALKRSGSNKYQQALDEFYQQWHKNPLVLDKWFLVQATNADSLAEIKTLLEHKDFDLLNPNRVRAVYGAFAMANPSLFHLADGSGYQLLAEGILKIDKQNPTLAARLMGAFSSWQKVEPVRSKLAGDVITEVKNTNGLSKNTYEIASKHLGSD
jgi:aminopeptidase N